MDEPIDSRAKSFQVVLPTSQQPVVVTALTELVSSNARTVACLPTDEEVGISQAYRSFVRQGTGVVQRLFGKSADTAYRLDVDGPVETGASFQLPVLLAHSLREAGRLHAGKGRREADPLAPHDLVWATGGVSALTYKVTGVGHVAEKLVNSRSLFEKVLEEGRRVVVLVPTDNADHPDPAMRRWLDDHGIPLHAVGSFDEVLRILHLPPIPRAADTAEAQWSGNPYPGLSAYDTATRDIFFGRSRAREEALGQLRAAASWERPFLAVVGRSGVGKSSLVRAGLLGDLIESAAPAAVRHQILRPSSGGSHPHLPLAEALRSILGLEQDASFDQVLGTPSPGATTAPSMVLIVDQLEELFSPAVDEASAREFGRLLDLAVKHGIWTIVTLRADAEGAIDDIPELTALAAGQRIYRLDRPTHHELVEIIESPVVAAGKRFADASIVSGIADMAHASPDSLPLLQVMLRRLFDQSGSRTVLDESAVLQAGSLDTATSLWADQSLERMLADGVDPALLDSVLASLVRLDRAVGAPLARSIPYPTDPASARVVDRLIADRLVAIDADNGAHPRVRLAHEALFRNWQHLVDLTRRMTLQIALRDDLEDRAARWDSAGRPDADLLHGRLRVDEAEAFLEARLLRHDPIVEPFVIASRTGLQEAEARERRLQLAERGRRHLARLAGILVIVAAIGFAGFFAFLLVDGEASSGRVAAGSGNIDAATASFSRTMDVPAAWMPSPSRHALAGALLDQGLVRTLVRWDERLEQVPFFQNADLLLTDDSLYAYSGNEEVASVSRCAADGANCTSLSLPQGWRSTYEYVQPFLIEEEGAVRLVSRDERMALDLPATGDLVFEPRPISDEWARQRQEAIAADPMGMEISGPAGSCDAAGRTCVRGEYFDARGSMTRFDVWTNRDGRWKTQVYGIALSYNVVNSTTISPNGEWLAISTDDTVQIWRSDANGVFSYERDRTLRIDAPPIDLEFDRTGARLFVGTQDRLISIELDPRLEIERASSFLAGLTSQGTNEDGHRIVLSGEKLMSLTPDGRRTGEVSIEIPGEDTAHKTFPEAGVVAVTTDFLFEDATTRLYSMTDLKPVSEPIPGEPIRSLPDGRLVMAAHDCTVTIWSATGILERVAMPEIPDHAGAVYCQSAWKVLDRKDGLLVLQGDSVFAVRLEQSPPTVTRLDSPAGKYALGVRDETAYWMIPEEGIVVQSPQDGLETRLIPFDETGKRMSRLNPEKLTPIFDFLVTDGQGRYALVVDDGFCEEQNDTTGPYVQRHGRTSLLFLEDDGASLRSRFLLKCPGSRNDGWEHNAFLTMERHADTTWLGGYMINGLVRWRGGEDLDYFAILNGPRDGMLAQLTKGSTATRTGDDPPRLVAPKHSESELFGSTRIRISPDGRTLVYFKEGTGSGQSDVKATVFRPDELQIEMLANATMQYFDSVSDVSFDRTGRLIVVSKAETDRYEMFDAATFEPIGMPKGVVDLDDRGNGVFEVMMDDGRQGRLVVPEAGNAVVDAIAGMLSQPVAVPAPLVAASVQPTAPDPMVLTIQKRLAVLGHYQQIPNGILDAFTRNAIRAFNEDDPKQSEKPDQALLDRLDAWIAKTYSSEP